MTFNHPIITPRNSGGSRSLSLWILQEELVFKNFKKNTIVRIEPGHRRCNVQLWTPHKRPLHQATTCCLGAHCLILYHSFKFLYKYIYLDMRLIEQPEPSVWVRPCLETSTSGSLRRTMTKTFLDLYLHCVIQLRYLSPRSDMVIVILSIFIVLSCIFMTFIHIGL